MVFNIAKFILVFFEKNGFWGKVKLHAD